MHTRKSKKILLYLFLLVILASINNKSLSKFKFDKVSEINISGLDEADNEKNLIDTNVLIILEKDNNNKFWGKAIRKNSDTDVGGGGIFQIIAGIGEFKELVGKNCNYALAATENFTVMQDVICKP